MAKKVDQLVEVTAADPVAAAAGEVERLRALEDAQVSQASEMRDELKALQRQKHNAVIDGASPSADLLEQIAQHEVTLADADGMLGTLRERRADAINVWRNTVRAQQDRDLKEARAREQRESAGADDLRRQLAQAEAELAGTRATVAKMEQQSADFEQSCELAIFTGDFELIARIPDHPTILLDRVAFTAAISEACSLQREEPRMTWAAIDLSTGALLGFRVLKRGNLNAYNHDDPESGNNALDLTRGVITAFYSRRDPKFAGTLPEIHERRAAALNCGKRLLSEIQTANRTIAVA